ncbi:MAG TPA: patatin-like phospholipase family protein [Gemmatimonadales bacterium]|nr:patatin-like phospholipase family protein [Gemmatimonadales bacterium]
MDALVLGGGNIKGAYQAGVVSALLQAGYQPGILTGISVGALNAGYVAGLTPIGTAPDWPAVGRELEQFWRANVTSPRTFLRKRGFLSILWSLLTGRWNGLVDTEPLADVVRRELAARDPRKTAVTLRVGAVNIRTGDLIYVGAEEPRLVEYILASTAEPVGMPLRFVGQDAFYDGGLRDVAPLKQATDLKADNVVAVVCQPEGVGPVEETFRLGDAFHLISRVSGIVTNEIVRNDLEWFLEVNRYVRERPDHPLLAGKRFIPILVIRPKEAIKLNLEKFTPDDIARMIQQGKDDAAREVRAAQSDPGHPGHELARRLRL